MNAKEVDGKLIANVFWPHDGETISASNDVGLHMDATYHGDRDEFWIVQTDKSGNEVARYNLKYVESFAWVEPISPASSQHIGN